MPRGRVGGAVAVRPLAPDEDRRAVAALWERGLAPGWPVLPGGLDLLQDGFVAVEERRVVGVVAVDAGGAVLLVVVDPEVRRAGVGTALLGAAVASLRARGVERAVAGSAGGECIWPGVPLDLPGATTFLERAGWVLEHEVADLVQDLRDPGIEARLTAVEARPAGVRFTPAAARDMPEVVDFERRCFPQWLGWFTDAESVLVGRDGGGAVRSALLLDGPGQASVLWPMLGEDCGTIGCVGVDPASEGRGVGSAMVAAATRILATRGVGRCHLSWVTRLGFYGRLGYEPWRRYQRAARTL